MNRFSKSERTIRRWIKRLGFSNFEDIENEEIRQGKQRTYDLKKKYYIFTWAQNATPVHPAFWANIKKYAEFLDAEIGVIQGRYQNPTSLWTSNMAGDEWWDETFTIKNKDGQVIFSYLDGSRTHLHQYLDILADIKIVPTARNPLTGFEGVSGEKSSIIGHPRVHLKTLPVLSGHPNKTLMTTGACTIKNYTDTKAGKKAEFHHTYGFVIVEIKDDLTQYSRQVTADADGTFTDLIYHVDGDVFEIDSCAAFIMGDIHVSNMETKIVDKTMKLFETIRPNRVVIHDIFDGDSVNHHEEKDPVKKYQRYQAGRNLVKKEIEGLGNFIDKYDLIQYKPIVVRSNHDMWIDRWITDTDWKKDIVNSAEYMEYALILLQGKAPKGLIPYLLEQQFGEEITCLGLDDSYKILGWELGQHGHLGSHGAKGSFEGFRNLNTKIIIGDKHVPTRLDGMLCAGTFSKLRMGYNNGASAWMHCGVMIHNSGKAQHIIYDEDGNFTTLI